MDFSAPWPVPWEMGKNTRGRSVATLGVLAALTASTPALPQASLEGLSMDVVNADESPEQALSRMKPAPAKGKTHPGSPEALLDRPQLVPQLTIVNALTPEQEERDRKGDRQRERAHDRESDKDRERKERGGGK